MASEDLRRGETQRATHAHTRRLHDQRLGLSNGNGHVSDEVLARAWRDVQLHWLADLPGYREIVRARVSKAARKAETRSQRIDRVHADVDYIGRSVEGCG